MSFCSKVHPLAGVKGALKAATGSFIGFILGTGIKTIVFVLILWIIVVFTF